MEAGSIKAIDKGSVHRICSGQVVLTLATAVKELVENSIDAGASILDIKLKEYGSEIVEVSDNGSGVEEKNFEGLTLKHHTSKLEDFSDLVNVETFGFRGEALSSLCALSDLSIVTRHKDVEVGTKLEYDHHGKVVSKTSVARQMGTTVTLQNLFYTLPVRHKEFQRNLKKEFVKMIHVLNAYCLINTGVRITCTNQTGKGSRAAVVSSKGNPTIKENISNIFGPKQVQSLMEFKQCKPTEDIFTEYGLKNVDSNTDMFRIEGYISKCEHGQGRSSADRQYYFINKRPCDHSKLSKLVNEVYHQYNRHQYPFVAISITMCRESVDVNVTPDKRQIFIENEKILMAVIKTSLIQMYEPTSSLYNVNSLETCSLGINVKKSPEKEREEEGGKSAKATVSSSLSNLKRTFSSTFCKEDSSSTSSINQQSKQRRLDSFVVKSKISSPYKENCHKYKQFQKPDLMDSNTKVVFETQESLKAESSCQSQDSCIVMLEEREIMLTDSESNISSLEMTGSQSSQCETITTESDSLVNTQESDKDSYIHESTDSQQYPSISVNETTVTSLPNNCDTPKCVHDNDFMSLSSPEFVHIDCTNDDEVDVGGIISNKGKTYVPVSNRCISSSESSRLPTPVSGESIQLTCFDECEESEKEIVVKTIKFDLKKFREKICKRKAEIDTSKRFCRTFRATISPGDNKAAEEELQKEIKKEMFGQMEILGQFNLGFIITKFGDDLFIVDQHATDEKYNFEMLQKHTVIQSQKLIHPQNLELTSSNEIILMENIEVFRKNGFDFLVHEEGEPTQRVKLVATPVSKNWLFGKDDIEELIFMLTDSPGVMCRPSRVRQMFASRACRKSIMIGTALSQTDMRKLVHHMGEIDQPWNCPHGRPTMRHLINLSMVPR